MGLRASGYLFFGFEISEQESQRQDPAASFACETKHFEDRDEYKYFLWALCKEGGPWVDAVDIQELASKQKDARDRLLSYCRQHGVLFKEPSWHLAAEYD